MLVLLVYLLRAFWAGLYRRAMVAAEVHVLASEQAETHLALTRARKVLASSVMTTGGIFIMSFDAISVRLKLARSFPRDTGFTR